MYYLSVHFPERFYYVTAQDTHTQVSQGPSHRRSPQCDPEQHHQRCTSLLTPKYDGACGRALHTCASGKTFACPSCPSLCVHIHSCDLIRRPKTDFRNSGRIVNIAWGYAVNIAWVYAFAAAITGARTVMDDRICELKKRWGLRGVEYALQITNQHLSLGVAICEARKSLGNFTQQLLPIMYVYTCRVVIVIILLIF